MKKFFALALSLALALTAFAGCSSTSASASTPSAASGSTAGSAGISPKKVTHQFRLLFIDDPFSVFPFVISDHPA